MAINFQTPTQIADEYLTYLKGLKPEVNISQTDSDWWIRSRVVGGVLAGLYADQRRIADDAFPQSARHEALARHLQLYFGNDFNPATQADGNVGVSGIPGTIYSIGTQFTYVPNGNVYSSTTGLTLGAAISNGIATGFVPVKSIAAGQNQNLLAGAPLTLSSPPPGSQTAAIAITDIADGTDQETDTAAATRILNRLQFPPAGGTANDYMQWALQADPSVVAANVIRFIFGPGTVGVVITAGTTNIDAALNSGTPIVRLPSASLIQTVQNYVDAKKPLTDCAFVNPASLKTVNVTVNVRFVDGNPNTVPSTQLTNPDGTVQTLTQAQLVVREVQRAIFKTPPGGRLFGTSGFVVASEIEQVLDDNLSAEPYNTGIISAILLDRDVLDLSATGANLMIAPNELAQPGTITVVSM